MSGPSTPLKTFAGDKLSTLNYFFTLEVQHGMIWAVK